MTQEEFNALMQTYLATYLSNGYYTSIYSGEQIDTAVGDVLNGNIVIPSSTTGSTKKYKITVDDSGTLTATEVTQ